MTSKIKFTILDGALAGEKFEYSEFAEFIIGRADDCKIKFPLDEKRVSAKHCNIVIKPATVEITDLGSTNGTKVDDILIGSKEQGIQQINTITADTNISVGDIRIKIEFSSDNNSSLHEEYLSEEASSEQSISYLEQILPWVKDFNISSKYLPAAIRDHRVVRILGKGKYGEVYMAIDSNKQKVALKKMLDEVVSSKDIRARFKQEIENLQYLNHQNIVRLKGSDIYENNFFYTMEYCEIGSLDSLIKFMGGTLSLDIAEMVIRQVLDGLTYIHLSTASMVLTKDGYENAKGLVHRDLKPSNILLTNDGLNLVAKIGDFGLSKALGVEAAKVHTEQISKPLGTYQFMCRRQNKVFKEAEPAGDVWAAAACLYYMLTGEYPRNFSKKIPLDRIVAVEDVIPILNRNNRIPSAIANVIDSALLEDKSNDDRTKFQTAADFQEALNQAFAQAKIN